MQVDINAARDIVLQAVTTQEGITAWWTAKGEVPPGVGQTMILWFRPHADVPFDVRVEEIGRDRVAWRPVSFPPPWVGTRMIWDFSDGPADSGTRVLFRFVDWREDDPVMPAS